MLTVRKRGKTFHADLMKGKVHVVRGSLGTRNQDASRRLIHKLETALSEGSRFFPKRLSLDSRISLMCVYARFRLGAN